MKNWYECKVRYEITTDSGSTKRVTESYLVDALSCTEAEARVIKEVDSYAGGTLNVLSVKKTNYKEVFLSSLSYPRFFKMKVAFITLNEDSGEEIETNNFLLVEASDLRSSLDRLDELMKGALADYSVKSISETNIMGVFLHKEESGARDDQ